MPHSVIFALITLGFLSACTGIGGPPPAAVIGGQYSDSVGFTGIGNEPF